MTMISFLAGRAKPSRDCGGAVVGCWALLAVAAAAALAARPAEGAETLRWKLKPGETLRYTMVQESTQAMKAMGQEFKSNMKQTVDLHWNVKSVSSDDVADMSQTIDRVRTRVAAPGNTFEFDSNSDKAPEGQIATILAPLLKAMVGAEFTFKMNKRGELSDVKVPQKLVDSLRNAGPLATAGGMLSEDGLKNLISQSSLTLPEAPLDKGKSWTQQSKVPLPMIGTMILDKTYTFQGPDPKAQGQLQIGLSTKVSLQPAAESNVAVKITSQDGTGNFVFSAQDGRIISSRVNDKLQMSLSSMGQEFEQTTDSVTTMTLGKPGESR